MADKYYTPKGIAVFPWLTRPDTKFNAEGDFKTTLRIPREEAQEMADLIQGIHDEYTAEELKKIPKGKKAPRVSDLPFTDVFDDDGNETGEVDFKFKTKAKFKDKSGKMIEKKLPIADSKGNPVTEEIAIYGGSTIRLSYNISPYNTGTLIGVSLRLIGVQVIDLVTGGGNSGGFGEVEGGSFESTGESSDKPEASDDDENF